MKINIPKKLINYKAHIKDKSNFFIYSRSLSLLKIGESKKKDVIKEIYLCYNPFMTALKLDINHFKKDKDIYKMYPAVIIIPAREVYAFMVFSSNSGELSLDENYLIFQKRNRITMLINNLNKNINVYKEKVYVEDTDTIDSTTLLDSEVNTESTDLNLKKIQKFVRKERKEKYLKPKVNKSLKSEKDLLYLTYDINSQALITEIIDVSIENDYYKIMIEFSNIDGINSYFIKRFNLFFNNQELEENIVIKTDLKIKSQTKKKTIISLDKNKFKEELRKENIKIELE